MTWDNDVKMRLEHGTSMSNGTLDADISAALARIAALEATLEKADALVDHLLDQTLYPMKYEAGLRCAINNYDAARAKTVKP